MGNLFLFRALITSAVCSRNNEGVE